MTRFHACAECARTLVNLKAGKMAAPEPGKRFEIVMGTPCDVHPSGVRLQATEIVDVAGELPRPFIDRNAPTTPTLLGARPDGDAPSSHDFRAPAQREGLAMPLGPETEIAARLLAVWLAESPFEAQRGEASDQVYVSRASSIARMLLQETRNR